MPARMVLGSQPDAGGSRFLEALIDDAGDFVVEGQDLGPAVEEFWGCHEYEWSRRVRAEHVQALARALGATDASSLLAIVHEKFSGDRARELDAALQASGVPVESWSRAGD